ncbi:MAG: penicillin-binding protein [Lachnospiraceae bacterium]|nr:penicillin-binding protein [Lachnospiraceae bacterium]
MNFGKNGVRKQLHAIQSDRKRIRSKSILTVVKVVLFVILFIAVVGTAAVYGIVRGIIAEAPDISTLDVTPQGISTEIYDSDGNLIETLVTSGSNRDPVTYDEVPEDLVNAFVAIEDSRFWTHSGVDIRGLLRAAVLGVQSGFTTTQGASTITQQLIKNNVFDGGAESSLGAKIVRKVQEQYLAIELEKVMSKEDIMINYLNTINLGSNCLGVQTAAKRYFDKDVSELTLSECAVIAGITQNPSGYNPITHPEANAERREIILQYMEEQGYITAAEREEALADPVYERIQEVNSEYEETDDSPYSYFVDRLITEVIEDLQTKCGYTEAQATTLLYSGGLQIYTTQDSDIQTIVDEEVSDPDNYTEVDNKYSFSYTLNISRNGETVYYTEDDVQDYCGKSSMNFDTQEEIEELVEAFKDATLEDSDEILTDTITYTLQPQTSVVLMEQSTGYVKAISGGRGEKTASLSLNRATSTRRSPGSTFKILTAFAPALDSCDQTLASVYYDEPYTDTSTGKTFRNWWGDSYVGYSNIRQAIVYSMNIVAVKCLVETVTPELGFEYALNFGFNTLYESKEINGQIYTDISSSLALGGLTDGVTNLQLTAAYAAIANGGTYTEPIFYTKILDSEGNVLIDNEPETKQVIKETTAFLLTDAMADSLESSSLYGLHSSTSTAAALDDMSAAGKSGTSTGSTDLWFVGYTPYYTMGIWSGFDDNSSMSTNESSSYHKVIWKKIMDRVDELEDLEDIGFEVPDGIVEVQICAKSGKIAREGVCTADSRSGMVYTEYFIEGTEPTETCDVHYTYQVCSESGQKATQYCPSVVNKVYIQLPDETTGTTDDDNYTLSSKARHSCSIHTSAPTEEETTEEETTEEGDPDAGEDDSGGDGEDDSGGGEDSGGNDTGGEDDSGGDDSGGNDTEGEVAPENNE